MDKQNDLHESDRNLLGGLVGAVAVAICVGPLLLVVSGRPSLVSIGLLLFMGCVAGSVGANTGEPLRAVVLGVLPFTMVAGFYLPFTIFFLKVADWWGFDPSRDTLTFDILAFMLSAAALGGICGFVGSVAGRAMPRSATEKRRWQFTLQETLWIFVLVALYLGPILYFLRERPSP